jgi:riboflavin synthase
MFTGLIEALAAVSDIVDAGAGRELVIACGECAVDLAVGESVAINGCCLTVVGTASSPPGSGAGVRFQLGPETLSKTNLGQLRVHDRVNVERALTLGDRLGGHIVQGHVDGTGTIIDRREEGDWVFMSFAAPRELLGQMVPKGSVAVDGVSLTIVEVCPDRFSVALIPHTLANTTLGLKATGGTVNLETDILAKYVARHLDVSQLSR